MGVKLTHPTRIMQNSTGDAESAGATRGGLESLASQFCGAWAGVLPVAVSPRPGRPGKASVSPPARREDRSPFSALGRGLTRKAPGSSLARPSAGEAGGTLT